MKTTYKTSKTIKEYTVNFRGYKLVVPVGSTVSNRTAIDNDDKYMFLEDIQELAFRHTGFADSLLRHDLTYYGLDIPKEYCEPYKVKQ